MRKLLDCIVITLAGLIVILTLLASLEPSPPEIPEDSTPKRYWRERLPNVPTQASRLG